VNGLPTGSSRISCTEPLRFLSIGRPRDSPRPSCARRERSRLGQWPSRINVDSPVHGAGDGIGPRPQSRTAGQTPHETVGGAWPCASAGVGPSFSSETLTHVERGIQFDCCRQLVPQAQPPAAPVSAKQDATERRSVWAVVVCTLRWRSDGCRVRHAALAVGMAHTRSQCADVSYG